MYTQEIATDEYQFEHAPACRIAPTILSLTFSETLRHPTMLGWLACVELPIVHLAASVGLEITHEFAAPGLLVQALAIAPVR